MPDYIGDTLSKKNLVPVWTLASRSRVVCDCTLVTVSVLEVSILVVAGLLSLTTRIVGTPSAVLVALLLSSHSATLAYPS